MRPASLILALAASCVSASTAYAQADDAAMLKAFETRYARAIDKAAAVTVSILVDRAPEKPRQAPPRLPGFMGGGGVFASRPDGPVSGFIVDADGWIATTYFNVEGELKKVDVTLPDGTIHPAEVKGWNKGMDVAVLKIEATGLPTLKAADPAEVRIGDQVIAVGRDPEGRGVTANPGILSAAGRTNGRSIQVDARLNYGNVGGPLVDLEGRFVGMSNKVSIKKADSLGQNSGVSMVVSCAWIVEELPKLKRGDRIDGGDGRPFLGVTGDTTYDGGDGALLQGTQAGGSAERAGLKGGDLVQELNGQPIKKFEDLRTAILKHKIGDVVKVKVKRGEEILEFVMPLGERPSE
jgi:serine protease Do